MSGFSAGRYGKGQYAVGRGVKVEHIFVDK